MGKVGADGNPPENKLWYKTQSARDFTQKENTLKIKLAVLFGGKSVEHEISVISAVQAMESVSPDKYDVIPVYITKKNEFYYGAALRDITAYKNMAELTRKCQRVTFVAEGGKTYLVRYPFRLFNRKPVSLIDVAFPVVHGTNVEDGALQGYLKTLNLPFVGCDVLASAVGMDKYVTKILLRQAGFPVLDCLRFTMSDYAQPQTVIAETEKKFPYPVIVKPVNLGSSIGIARAGNAGQLDDALSTAFTYADKVIIEPVVVRLKEVNCAVLGDGDDAQPSECEEPRPSGEILSYDDKYMSGAKGKGSKGMAGLERKIPAAVSPEMREKIQRIAVAAFKHLDCNGVARIDFMIDEAAGDVWLNEINTIPGSLAYYLWEHSGISYAGLIDKLVALALKRQRKEESITYSFATNILSLGNGLLGGKGTKKR